MTQEWKKKLWAPSADKIVNEYNKLIELCRQHKPGALLIDSQPSRAKDVTIIKELNGGYLKKIAELGVKHVAIITQKNVSSDKSIEKISTTTNYNDFNVKCFDDKNTAIQWLRNA